MTLDLDLTVFLNTQDSGQHSLCAFSFLFQEVVDIVVTPLSWGFDQAVDGYNVISQALKNIVNNPKTAIRDIAGGMAK